MIEIKRKKDESVIVNNTGFCVVCQSLVVGVVKRKPRLWVEYPDSNILQLLFLATPDTPDAPLASGEVTLHLWKDTWLGEAIYEIQLAWIMTEPANTTLESVFSKRQYRDTLCLV